MRSRLRPVSALALLVATLTVAACTASPAPDTTTQPSPSGDVVDSRISGAIEQLVDAGATAAVIDVRSGGEATQAAAGTVSSDEDSPAAPDAPLRIASVTKTMTAALVMQLVDEGVLALDTDVDAVLPGVVAAPAPVTIRTLLNHTSGIPDYFSSVAPDLEAYLDARDRIFEARELVDIAQAEPWVSPPGEAFAYSNTNYAVLRVVIEEVTGDDFADVLRERIVEPLGLTETAYPDSATMPAGALRGEVETEDGTADTSEASPSLWNAAAGVTSTVGDVGTFFQALFGGEVVSASSLDAMREVGSVGYGLGILAGGDACGAQPPELVYGQRGNGVGYRMMVFASSDGERVVTLGWTGGTYDPASDPLLAAGNTALVTALQTTC